jgi:hypothetical protein
LGNVHHNVKTYKVCHIVRFGHECHIARFVQGIARFSHIGFSHIGFSHIRFSHINVSKLRSIYWGLCSSHYKVGLCSTHYEKIGNLN